MSVFQHGMLNNHITILGTAVALLIMVVVLFIPALNGIFLTARFPAPVWAINLLYLGYIAGATEWLKRAARVDPKGWVSQHLVW